MPIDNPATSHAVSGNKDIGQIDKCPPLRCRRPLITADREVNRYAVIIPSAVRAMPQRIAFVAKLADFPIGEGRIVILYAIAA
jgi:hypothetical protein